MQRGMVGPGGPVRWDEIESYQWEEDRDQALNDRARRGFPFRLPGDELARFSGVQGGRGANAHRAPRTEDCQGRRRPMS